MLTCRCRCITHVCSLQSPLVSLSVSGLHILAQINHVKVEFTVLSSTYTIDATFHTDIAFMCTYTLRHSPHVKCLNHKKQQSVLWQVILSGEECHCNPLMLLSHPQRVWVSVPALIYTQKGWRKWTFSLWMYEAWISERERVRAPLRQTSYKRFYNVSRAMTCR